MHKGTTAVQHTGFWVLMTLDKGFNFKGCVHFEWREAMNRFLLQSEERSVKFWKGDFSYAVALKE